MCHRFGVDLRSAVDAGWNRQLALLRELVRAPSTLGNELAAQELVAEELRSIGLEPVLWDVDPDVPGASPPLIGVLGPPERDRADGRARAAGGR